MNRFACLIVFLVSFLAMPVLAQDGYKVPPDALAALVDAPIAPAVSISPDKSSMLLLTRQSLPGIAQLAEPELRLAGTRINPRNNGPSRSRYYTAITIKSIDGDKELEVTGIPEGALISNVSFSPGGKHIAFTVSFEDRIDLYLADAASGNAVRLIDRALNAISGRPYSWMPDGSSLLVKAVSAVRGEYPLRPAVPTTPVIQENIGKIAPARTYQDLLATPYDEDLFEWMMQSDLLSVSLDGTVTSFGVRGIVNSVSASPDGQYVLVQTHHRPFSYLVPSYRFPKKIEVRDRVGKLVQVIDDLPLMEEVPTGFGSTTTGIRSIGWRQDADATLAWVEALDGGDGNVEVDFRDVVLQLEAPFSGETQELIRLPLRYAGISWSDQGFALVSERWWSTRKTRTYRIDTGDSGFEVSVLFDRSSEDRYNDPGSPMTETDATGRRLLMVDDGGSIYLRGAGASPEGNRPFLRKMNLTTGETTELFRSEAPYYESFSDWVDVDEGTYLTSRESKSEPPNFYLRQVGSDDLQAVTHFEHPYPEMDAISKEFITYEREDGIQLSATLYLPAGYVASRDGPLPTLIWAYPNEFKSAAAAGQVSGSPYRFKRVSYWGAIGYVTQGYAIIDGASMPIVGEGDTEPNDTFIEQLVLSAEAAINEGIRRGVVDADRVAIGGHSYGAFMTANLLAHSDLFRAGIARSGAYNRSLTPFGFQAEPRTFWEAPEIYFAMSPFMHADKVDEPILLIHGMADNNSGTFPIQSERFYHGLKGNGRTARLVMLPHESHGYRARESLLHMMYEMNNWLETYVKNAPPRSLEVGGPTGR